MSLLIILLLVALGFVVVLRDAATARREEGRGHHVEENVERNHRGSQQHLQRFAVQSSATAIRA